MKKERILSINDKSPIEVFDIIKEYDIISFDIFDTLIFRPFYNPKDLFRTLSEHYTCLNFYHERIQAEKKARKTKVQKFGHQEVTLNDIYKELNKNIGINIEEGCLNEFEKELEFVYPNPYLKEIYDILIKNNKKVILVSDMYLSNNYMKKLLSKCGYNNYEKLYVSCDYEVNKKYGELFEIVKQDFSNNKIIHIGDNKNSDYLMSMKHGIESLLYNSPHSLPSNNYNMTATINSLYNGIIYNKFYNCNFAMKNNEISYIYGYEYCGIFILGYVNWIHEYAKNNNIDKILFLARDGYILKKVYDKLFDDISSEYSLWSRYATLKTDTKGEFSRFIWQFVNRKVKKQKDITVKEILNEMGNVDTLLPILRKIGIYEDMQLRDKKTLKVFNTILEDNADLLFKLSDKYSNNAKKYYTDKIGNAKKIAIVDIGYRASGAISLINLFKKWGINCDAKALIAFGTVNRNSFDDTLVLNNTVISYVFANNLNKNLCLSKNDNELLLEVSIIEILLASAPKPSFHYFDSDSSGNIFPIYEEEDTYNYETINELHQGIIDFIADYICKIGSNKYLLNIPGYDSYLPIKSITCEKDKLDKFANDFSLFSYAYMITDSSKKRTYFSDIYQEYKESKRENGDKK